MEGPAVGKGSFASVFVHVGEDSVSAVKKISIRNELSFSFTLNETSILSACSHPHIVSYLSSRVDEAEGALYIEMEHLSGGTLEQYHFREQYWLLEKWMGQIGSALVYLHERGIVHRDIKLSNLMLSQDKLVKVIDFGVSAWKWTLPFEADKLIGSPCYMAPEMFLGKDYGEKVDVYALGVCLYQLTHLRQPYRGTNKHEYWANTVQAHLTFDQHCPQRLVHLMELMLRREPEERPSASEVLDMLSSPAFREQASAGL